MNSMAVGACHSFQFFRQRTWFLGNNRALSKFRYQNHANHLKPLYPGVAYQCPLKTSKNLKVLRGYR